jgi:hypothetical protein
MGDLPAGLAAERHCDRAAVLLGAQLKLTVVIPGRREASNPEPRDSGFSPADCPGMTDSN